MLTLVVDQIVPMRQYTETALRKEFRVRSKLLSDFHRRDVFLKAGIYLPESYATNPGKRYPTIYVIPGFGGDHYPGVSERVLSGPAPDGVEFLGVLLNPNCPEGHHVFADSANNGPVGRAFVEEFLPAFDRKFRTIGDPRARYLTGHSSGGWSSLWLQITHPDDFGGTWSTSPDPVDFRDFQRIDIYRPNQNVYFDEQGNQRPLARFASRPVLFFRSFDQMELTLGHGGQLRSFEAVFSPRGNDGQPLSLWSRQSGAINGDVARAWQKYDIRLVLERNWPKLRSKLQGKLHVFTGDADTFYLDGATRLLKQSLASLQSDAIVELHQGTDHFTLLDSAMLQRIRSEMAARFRATFERPGSR